MMLPLIFIQCTFCYGGTCTEAPRGMRKICPRCEGRGFTPIEDGDVANPAPGSSHPVW
jgi:hypothetical protein